MLAARLVSSLPRKPRAASSAAAALRSGSCRGPAPRCLAGAAGGDRTEATAQQLLYSIVESPGHRLDDHVERPERIAGVLKGLGEASFLGEGQLSSKVRELPATRQATSEEAGLIHSYAESLKKKAALSSPGVPVALADLGDPDGVTFATPSTYTDALHALGASLDLVDAVVEASEKGTPSPAFGIIRPPGHHATPSGPLGYCIFNNAAVAARYAQHAHGLKKIFILDYDVHNGNGTCEAFWEDSSVFVVDIHEESTVYPPEFIPAGAEDIGAGEGEGFTMNVPLPRYSGHEAVQRVFEQVIVPAFRRFQPDMVIVSAGYDAHMLDPFQMLQYRSCTYHWMATKLRHLAAELCCGRLMFLLEGGYNVDALGEAVTETWLALVGESTKEGSHPLAEPLPQPEPMEDVEDLIQQLKRIHKL